jgi:prolyl-tRNA synthetase
MRWSDYFIPTLKTIPKDIKSPTIRYLVKSGILRIPRKGCSFLLPLGVKLLQKIDNVMRDIFARHKGLEVDLHCTESSPVQLDTHKKMQQQDMRGFFSQNISSYRQLPLLFYQFSTKPDVNNIKDERFGSEMSIRFLEAFMLESGASADVEKLEVLNKIVEDILCHLGLNNYSIRLLKDSGVIAHWIVCDNNEGDQEIAFCTSCNAVLHPARIDDSFSLKAHSELKELQCIETPRMVTVEDVCQFFGKAPHEILKTIILTADGMPLAVLLRGDVQLSLKKLKQFSGRKNIQLADEVLIREITNAPIGFSGPIGLKKNIQIIGDYSILQMVNCVAGANREDYHFVNVNLNRDFKAEKFADLVQPYVAELCPHCKGKAILRRFHKIAELYSPFTTGKTPIIIDGEKSKDTLIISYLRIDYAALIPCLVEAYKTEKGMVWPSSIAPFKVVILLLNPHIEEIREKGEALYKNLQQEGIESLLDDRSIGVGTKFSDAELLGIPVQMILGKNYLENKQIELKQSRSGNIVKASLENIVEQVREMLENYDAREIS